MISVIVALVLSLGPPNACKATTFGGRADKWRGGPSPVLGRRVALRDHGVAHRSLPLRSWVLIYLPRTRRWAIAQVIDRGPFGRRDVHGKWYNGVHFWKAHREAGVPVPSHGWLACLDLAPATSRALGHRGRERILFWVWDK